MEEGNVKEYEIFSENQLMKDQKTNLRTEPTVDVCINQNGDEILVISPSEEKKRRYEAAFEGDSAAYSSENNKKPRKSNELETDLADCDLVEDESNSINDASDALSEEEEDEYPREETVNVKPKKLKKALRETIIDDDIIIEEDSNDLKTDEEQSNQNNEYSVRFLKRSGQFF